MSGGDTSGGAVSPPANPRRPARTLGFVDIGTNSVRLVVARLDPDRTWATVTAQKEAVRLGEGEFGATNTLQPAAMDRAVHVCRTFVDLARAHGADEIVAVATAATREASNRSHFVRRLRKEAGLDVHVVSGKEEARLVFLGVLTRVNLGERRALVIDIGGGSTEIAYGDGDGAVLLDSLSVGAIRLTSAFPEAASQPLTARRFSEMRRRVQVAVSRSKSRLAGERIDVVYGTSGTIRNLTAVAARQRPDEENGRADVITRRELKAVAKVLRGSDIDRRRTVPGLSPERADIIVAGAAILDALMEELGLSAIQALADCGVREGLMLDHLAREADLAAGDVPGVRRRSVLQLARTTGYDERHARHVGDLTLQLFDSARSCGLHRLGSAERDLLHHAATLHDIGTFLNYTDHHLHSAYLIRNADLLGFDQSEIAMIAAIALFHRKGRPTPRHPALAELDPRSRKAIGPLSTYLRIAEYLDRSHSGAIARLTLRCDGPGGLILEVHASHNWDLERWRLENRRQPLEEALGRTLTLREIPG